MRLTLLLLLLPLYSLHAQLAGQWFGVLDVSGQEVPVNIELTEEGDRWAGTLQSPSQSELRLPLSSVDVAGDSLSFSILAAGISYEGMVVGNDIRGRFSQSTFSTELDFSRTPPTNYRVDTPTAAGPRPQDPTDFPYRRSPVTFSGGAPDVTLAGELTLPALERPRALLVLVSGSGAQNRDEDLGPTINHRPFLVLSDFLTREGYGVLRYDDRGVGESTGDFSAATSADFARDAAAAVHYLENLGDSLAELPIGLAGHSEGGMIGPMVAAETDALDFLVLLAAPGEPIRRLMAVQRREVGGHVPEDEVLHQAVYAYAGDHGEADRPVFTAGLLDTLRAVYPRLPDSVRQNVTDTNQFLQPYLDSYASPWMRYFIAFDPTPYLKRLTLPVLAINGDLDQQVSVENLSAIGKALDVAGNRDVTLVTAPKLNHLLQPAKTGSPAEYGEIEITLDPSVLRTIDDWLDARFD
jgi:pimeloyl-ACP methyl ester carboxylesterase